MSGVLWWESEGVYFIAEHSQLQISQHVDAVLEKGTTIIEWEGVGECSGEGRMDVRQRSRGLGGNLEWKSEGAYFIA